GFSTVLAAAAITFGSPARAASRWSASYRCSVTAPLRAAICAAVPPCSFSRNESLSVNGSPSAAATSPPAGGLPDPISPITTTGLFFDMWIEVPSCQGGKSDDHRRKHHPHHARCDPHLGRRVPPRRPRHQRRRRHPHARWPGGAAVRHLPDQRHPQ